MLIGVRRHHRFFITNEQVGEVRGMGHSSQVSFAPENRMKEEAVRSCPFRYANTNSANHEFKFEKTRNGSCCKMKQRLGYLKR